MFFLTLGQHLTQLTYSMTIIWNNEVRNANPSLRDGQLKLYLDLIQYNPFKGVWMQIGS